MSDFKRGERVEVVYENSIKEVTFIADAGKLCYVLYDDSVQTDLVVKDRLRYPSVKIKRIMQDFMIVPHNKIVSIHDDIEILGSNWTPISEPYEKEFTISYQAKIKHGL